MVTKFRMFHFSRKLMELKRTFVFSISTLLRYFGKDWTLKEPRKVLLLRHTNSTFAITQNQSAKDTIQRLLLFQILPIPTGIVGALRESL